MPSHTPGERAKKKTRLGPAGRRKFRTVLGEFKRKTLSHGGTGKTVQRRDVALAIAFSEGSRDDKRRRKKAA